MCLRSTLREALGRFTATTLTGYFRGAYTPRTTPLLQGTSQRQKSTTAGTPSILARLEFGIQARAV